MSDTDPQIQRERGMHLRIRLWGLYLFAVILGLAFAWSPLAERLRVLLPFLTVAVSAFALVSFYQMTGKLLVAAASILVVTLVCSVSGAYFGFPFGDIAYTQALGPKLLDVPLGVPFVWLSVLLPAWIVAGTVLKYRHVVVAAIVVTAFDALLELAADSLDLWHWQGGMPTELNYLTWFCIAWWSFTILRKFAAAREGASLAPHMLGAEILFLLLADVGTRYIAPMLF